MTRKFKIENIGDEIIAVANNANGTVEIMPPGHTSHVFDLDVSGPFLVEIPPLPAERI